MRCHYTTFSRWTGFGRVPWETSAVAPSFRPIGMYPDGEANACPDPVVAEYGEAQTPVCASHRALRESVDFRDPTR